MEDFYELDNVSKSQLNILMITVNSFILHSQSVMMLSIRLAIEFFQVLYLMFKPKVRSFS